MTRKVQTVSLATVALAVPAAVRLFRGPAVNPITAAEDAFEALRSDVAGLCAAFWASLPSGWIPVARGPEPDLADDVAAINDVAAEVDPEVDILASAYRRDAGPYRVPTH